MAYPCFGILAQAPAALVVRGPLHLRNAPTKLMKQLGYGKDYKYAHAYQGNFVQQQFLPDEVKDSRIWHPQNNAQEAKIKERMQSLWGERFKE